MRLCEEPPPKPEEEPPLRRAALLLLSPGRRWPRRLRRRWRNALARTAARATPVGVTLVEELMVRSSCIFYPLDRLTNTR